MSSEGDAAGDMEGPGRFHLLATALAGRPLRVTAAAARDAPHTDGVHVFVSAERDLPHQRREVLVQAALLGAGSLDPGMVRALRGRSRVARRYLALEGRRALAELAHRVPAAAALTPGPPSTTAAEESLRRAQSRAAIADPPEWFGQIRPARLLGQPARATGAAPTERDLRLEFEPTEIPETDDEEAGEKSKVLDLFQSPLGSNALQNFLSKVLGSSRTPDQDSGGGQLPGGWRRRVDAVGPHARPRPVPLRFVDDDAPGPAGGVGGALYPEWDVYKGRYRPEWCRVLEWDLGPAPGACIGKVERDETLRRRLARVGLGPQVIRRRPDGEDLDVDAVIDFAVDVRAGRSPAEHVYLERRKLRRDLGVLILLDASGSAGETDREGRSVHEHQRRAAATLAAILEELGDRVALYGFRSRGRAAVHMLAVKPFTTRFGAGGRAHLDQLEPAGYTRLGAAIRHAGELLETEAGTPNRLLVVLSDGFPYDDGYEARYGEADARQALTELRLHGIACLCLSIGASTSTEALERVFGSSSHARAPTLSELSGRMDELFLAALQELAAPLGGRRPPLLPVRC